MHRTRLVSALLGILLTTFASAAQAQLRSQLFVAGLSAPVAFVQDPSLPGVQYVVQQGGRIRVIQNGVLLGTDFLDLTAVTRSGGEQGLLGLVFAPDSGTSRRFYVNFTNLAGDTVIARFLRSAADPLRADPATRFDLVWPGGQPYIDQPFVNHNGGDLSFGPDGYLYIPLGDGGGGNDPAHRAQDPSTLLGKILRIDVGVQLTHPTGYVVPASNPFAGTPGVLPEIWAFGLRNPWRVSFDDPSRGGTGAMLVADVGQATREEINYEPAGRGGRNYGWRNREGSVSNVGTLPPFSLPLTDPLYDYGRAEGQVVTGGYVYRGTVLGAAYRGRYFFADLGSSRLWSLGLAITPGTGEATVVDVDEHTGEVGRGALGISAFGVDGAGELYTVGHGTGEIHRLILDAASGNCPSVKPAPDWVCVNGGWLPPGLVPPDPSPLPPTPPPPPPSPSTCTSVKPASDWVCVNGGWLPPGLVPANSPAPPGPPAPPSPPPQSPSTCTSVKPAADWVCVDGGWLPPGLTPPGTPPPPPTPTVPAGCATPDPFIGIPGLAGICLLGGWIPVMLIESGATVEFATFEFGFWGLRLDDGRLFSVHGGLPDPFRTEGRRVTIVGKIRIDIASPMGSPLELLQIQ